MLRGSPKKPSRPDEAALTAEFIAFLKAVSAKRHPTGVMPRFNQGRAAGCVDAEFIVPDGLPPDLRVGLFAQPGDVSGPHPVRERHLAVRHGSRRSRDVDQGLRRAGRQPDAGRVRAGFHPEQPSGDDGGRDEGVPRAAAGGGGWRRTDGALLPVASARGRRGGGVASARDQSPRDSVLEHDALPVRRRPRGQVHRAPRVPADHAAAVAR